MRIGLPQEMPPSFSGGVHQSSTKMKMAESPLWKERGSMIGNRESGASNGQTALLKKKQEEQNETSGQSVTQLQALVRGWLARGQKNAMASTCCDKNSLIDKKVEDDASGATIRSYEDDSSTSHVEDGVQVHRKEESSKNLYFDTDDDYSEETVHDDDVDNMSQATEFLEIVVADEDEEVEIIEEEITEHVDENGNVIGESLEVHDNPKSSVNQSMKVDHLESANAQVNSKRPVLVTSSNVHPTRWSTSALTDRPHGDLERRGSTKLQAFARGFLVRQESKRRLSEMDWLLSIFDGDNTFAAPECIERECDVSKIQALARGFLVRTDSKRRISEVDWLLNTFSTFAADIDVVESEEPSQSGSESHKESREEAEDAENPPVVRGGSVGSLTTDSASQYSTPLCEYAAAPAKSFPPIMIHLPSDLKSQSVEETSSSDKPSKRNTAEGLIPSKEGAEEQAHKRKSIIVLQALARGFICRTRSKSNFAMNRLRLTRFSDPRMRPKKNVPTRTDSMPSSFLPPRVPTAPAFSNVNGKLQTGSPRRYGSYQIRSSADGIVTPNKLSVSAINSFDSTPRSFGQSTRRQEGVSMSSTFASRQAAARKDLEKRACLKIQALLRGYLCRNKVGRRESAISDQQSKSHGPNKTAGLPRYTSMMKSSKHEVSEEVAGSKPVVAHKKNPASPQKRTVVVFPLSMSKNGNYNNNHIDTNETMNDSSSQDCASKSVSLTGSQGSNTKDRIKLLQKGDAAMNSTKDLAKSWTCAGSTPKFEDVPRRASVEGEESSSKGLFKNTVPSGTSKFESLDDEEDIGRGGNRHDEIVSQPSSASATSPTPESNPRPSRAMTTTTKTNSPKRHRSSFLWNNSNHSTPSNISKGPSSPESSRRKAMDDVGSSEDVRSTLTTSKDSVGSAVPAKEVATVTTNNGGNQKPRSPLSTVLMAGSCGYTNRIRSNNMGNSSLQIPPLSPRTPFTALTPNKDGNSVVVGGGSGPIKVTVTTTTTTGANNNTGNIHNRPPPVPRFPKRISGGVNRPFPIEVPLKNNKAIPLSPTSPRTELKGTQDHLEGKICQRPPFTQRNNSERSMGSFTGSNTSLDVGGDKDHLDGSYHYDPNDPFDDDMTVKSVQKAVVEMNHSSPSYHESSVPLYQSWNTFDLPRNNKNNSRKSTGTNQKTKSIPVRRNSCPVPQINIPASAAMSSMHNSQEIMKKNQVSPRKSSPSITSNQANTTADGHKRGGHLLPSSPNQNPNKTKNRVRSFTTTVNSPPKVRWNSFCSGVPTSIESYQSQEGSGNADYDDIDDDDISQISSMSIQDRIKLFQR